MNMPAPPSRPAICGAPVASGALLALPQIEMASLPRDDQGLPELILHVTRDRDRFCYTYTLNGVKQHVAPVLRTHRGERFAIRIVNDLPGPAKGAALAASMVPPCMPMVMKTAPAHAFTGYLNHTLYARSAVMPPVDVNLHLHGFQGAAAQENVFLSTLSNAAHACEYDVTIPQTQPIGTYFYHPHAHGMSDDEVAGGLAGMWIVAPDKPQLAGSDQHEVVIRYRVPYVLDNPFMPSTMMWVPAGAQHQAALKGGPVRAYDPFDPPPWPSSVPLRVGTFTLTCGHLSSSLLTVNGVDAPVSVTVPAGRPQLLQLLNATSDSFAYLRLHDASGNARAMPIVERDGIPFSADSAHPLSRYLAMDALLLVPTNRASMLITLKPGDVLTLYADHQCLGPVGEYMLRHDLLTIRAGPLASPVDPIATAPLAGPQSAAVQLLRYARAHPSMVRRRAITYTAYLLPSEGKKPAHPEFYITETSNRNFHERPFWPVYGKNAMVPQPDIIVKRGSIEEWYLFNATMEPHTFHIHQMAFVAEEEQPQPIMLDTVLVRTGAFLANKADPDYPLVKPGLTKILLDFRNVPRGTFVFHCHMLFHEDRGMMGIIKVE
jgi:FtsP/CotA-like multicopper oxidase with cupredoxin domain